MSFIKNQKVKHHSGTIYTIRDVPNSELLEANAEPFYKYEGVDGQVWLRCKSEMEDGRFTDIREGA